MDNKCGNYAQQQAEDEEERIAEQRMLIILRNGNSGEHYDCWDNAEEQDIE
jgi:hypothetical protein